MTRRRAGIADVARLAGVSVGTVSNVINGTAAVRPQTRARVEAAIRELGFRPNSLARLLVARTRQLQPVGQIFPSPALTTVGYVSVDYTARLDVLPHRDDRVTAQGIEKSLGGPAANVAVMAAGLADRFPVAVELVTAIGDDADSDWALIELSRKNVDTIAIRRRPGQRLSRCIVLVEPNGSRTIINEPFDLQESDLAGYVGPSAGGVRCLHIEGFQVPRMLDSVRAIRRSDWLISLQTTGLPPPWRTAARLRELIGTFDLVFLNRDVARDATDCRGGMMQLVDSTLSLIAEAPARGIVVLTLGGDGALVLPPERTVPVHVPAVAVEVVDTTGAGDAFAGAFLAAWLNTGDPVRAARYGTAAGSIIVAVEGAQGCAPTAAALDRLMESMVAPGSRAAAGILRSFGPRVTGEIDAH